MLKKHCFLLFALIASYPLFGQNVNQKYSIGLQFSPSLIWVRAPEAGVTPDGARAGFDYGIMIERNINERYIFSTGLYASHRGGYAMFRDTLELQSIGGSFGSQTRVNYRTQFLEIPLHMRLRVPTASKVTPYAQFGLNTGFKVGARADVTPASGMEIEKERINKDIRTFTFGLAVGGGIEIELNENNRVMLGLLFHNFFNDSVKHRRPGNNKIAQNNLMLRVGFFF